MLKKRFLDHESIFELNNANSIHVFSQFEESPVECLQCHFKQMDLTRENLYTMGVPAILDDNDDEV